MADATKTKTDETTEAEQAEDVSQDTTTDETETTETEAAPVTLAEAVENVQDGSRMVAGTSPDEAVENIAGLAAGVVATHRSATQARKEAARAIAHYAMRLVLLPNGVPDWQGVSKLSETILTFSLDKVLSTQMPDEKGEKKRLRNSVMQHVRTTYRELEIRDYVASTETDMNGELFWPDGPDDSDVHFVAKVRSQYKLAGLAVPAKYQSPEDKQAARGASGTAGPKNPQEDARKGVEALQHLTPIIRAARILQAASDLVGEIHRGEVKGLGSDKQAVSELLNRTSVVTLFGAKVLDGATKGGDADFASSAMYDAEQDDPSAADES